MMLNALGAPYNSAMSIGRMRMDPAHQDSQTAWMATNRRRKADITQTYGEKRFAKRIARAVV